MIDASAATTWAGTTSSGARTVCASGFGGPMIEFVIGLVLGLVLGLLFGRYEPALPEEAESISPVSLDFWSVPSSQVDLPPAHEYRAVDEALPESKRAELVRKLAERAGQST